MTNELILAILVQYTSCLYINLKMYVTSYIKDFVSVFSNLPIHCSSTSTLNVFAIFLQILQNIYIMHIKYDWWPSYLKNSLICNVLLKTLQVKVKLLIRLSSWDSIQHVLDFNGMLHFNPFLYHENLPLYTAWHSLHRVILFIVYTPSESSEFEHWIYFNYW